jgi:hypothetical protein
MNGFWGRRLGAVVIVALVLFGMLYVGDWLVLRFRVARGTAFGGRSPSVSGYIAEGQQD